MRFALKVDVDTYRGMRDGLPRILDIMNRRAIQGTIFVSMGPDHSGRAIRRIFTKPGFLEKMRRTNAVSLYGPRTLLYGTLLPGPRIAERNADVLRRIESEGHEAGVHGWDHVRWQDGLHRFDEPTIARELERACDVYEAITGHPPRSTAAPGWIANERSLAVQDRLGLLYSSDVRGAGPFLPRVGGRTFRTPQVPTTLPTLDELMGVRMIADAEIGEDFQTNDRPRRDPAYREAGPTRFNVVKTPVPHERSRGSRTRRLIRVSGQAQEAMINDFLVSETLRQAAERPLALVVHTIHAEVEGVSRAAALEDLLDRLRAEGARFARLDEVAARASSEYSVDLPVCDVVYARLAGRSGVVAVQKVD